MAAGEGSNPETRTSKPSHGLQPPSSVTKAPLPESIPPSIPSDLTFADAFRLRVEQQPETAAIYLQQAERIERTERGADVVLTSSAALTMLQAKEYKQVLDTIATELIGKAVSVSLIMKEPQFGSGTALESAKEEPLVKRFLEVFRGDLAQIKPAKGE